MTISFKKSFQYLICHVLLIGAPSFSLVEMTLIISMRLLEWSNNNASCRMPFYLYGHSRCLQNSHSEYFWGQCDELIACILDLFCTSSKRIISFRWILKSVLLFCPQSLLFIFHWWLWRDEIVIKWDFHVSPNFNFF